MESESEALKNSANCILIAAIDFGTAASGYAFCLKSKPDNISMNKNWGGEFGHTSYKTPTCVLTGPDEEFVSFGFTAEKHFTSKKNSEAGYNLYRNFKMLLHDKQISLSSKIKSTTGKERLAIDIFKMALLYIMDHLKKTLEDATTYILDTDTIKWVITVPAIWTDTAKHFMREACLRAGLISNIHSTNLVIALEPEAASMFCRQLKSGDMKQGTDVELNEGDVYIVIDCGGGTIDIAVHIIQPSGDVKEIYPPSGGPWGGTCADQALTELLQKLFGKEFIESYKVNYSKHWMDLMLYFERNKATLKSTDEDSVINLSISYKFGKEFENFSEDIDIEEAVGEKEKHLGVSFDNGHLVLSHNTSKELFKTSISKIICCLEEMLKDSKLSEVKHIMLVGGYGDCEILQSEIRKLFQEKANVIIPIEAQLAIVKGAVLFGLEPNNITSRIAKCGYGYEIMVPFDEKKHDPRHKVPDGGKEWCSAIMKYVVKKGEQINFGTEQQHNIRVSSEACTKGYTELDIYSSDNNDAMYTYDKEVKKLCTLKILHEDCTSLYKESKITVITVVGGTELLIRAKLHGNDNKQSKWVETIVAFHSE